MLGLHRRLSFRRLFFHPLTLFVAEAKTRDSRIQQSAQRLPELDGEAKGKPALRRYRAFSWKQTNLRLACDLFEVLTQAVVAERRRLERYIARQPEFQHSLVPVALLADAPESARRMAVAAQITGLGPMSAVAGALAQIGAEAAMQAGCQEAIVENGGDMFLYSPHEVLVALHAGAGPLGNALAFQVKAEEMPLALCSSSSLMGHSLSFGRCDLATVAARDAALADAAVTLVCNLIRREADIAPTLERVGALPGIDGILAVKNGKVGIWGSLPQLVRNQDSSTDAKITRDLHADHAALFFDSIAP